MLVEGVLLKTANLFNVNYRERSPVIAKVITGNKLINSGDIILCHHNSFYAPSPYHLQDDLYSIPLNHTIFAKINNKGKLSAVCGNVLGERIPIKTHLGLPPELQKKYIDRIKVIDKGWTTFRNGATVLCRPNAPYDIVYIIDGVEKTVTKLNSEMAVGILV